MSEVLFFVCFFFNKGNELWMLYAMMERKQNLELGKPEKKTLFWQILVLCPCRPLIFQPECLISGIMMIILNYAGLLQVLGDEVVNTQYIFAKVLFLLLYFRR